MGNSIRMEYKRMTSERYRQWEYIHKAVEDSLRRYFSAKVALVGLEQER